MAGYYKIHKNPNTFDNIQLEAYGETKFTETERGLNGKCEEGGQHKWLVLPHEPDQKHYLMCLKCYQHSHL